MQRINRRLISTLVLLAGKEEIEKTKDYAYTIAVVAMSRTAIFRLKPQRNGDKDGGNFRMGGTMRIPEPVQVSSYSGSKGEEAPRAFRSTSTGRLLVAQVLERWYQEGMQRELKEYFRVLASDGETYTLYRDSSLDLWFLEKIRS